MDSSFSIVKKWMNILSEYDILNRVVIRKLRKIDHHYYFFPVLANFSAWLHICALIDKVKTILGPSCYHLHESNCGAHFLTRYINITLLPGTRHLRQALKMGVARRYSFQVYYPTEEQKLERMENQAEVEKRSEKKIYDLKSCEQE